MIEPPSPDGAPAKEATAPVTYFKDSNTALRELRKLQPPLTDDARAAFIEKVAKGTKAKPIAFSLLAFAWTGKPDARWNLVRAGLRQLLLGDRPLPDADVLSQTSTRRAWLEAEFGTDHRAVVAKTFLCNFSYLRPLYLILAEPDNEAWLEFALADFLEELDGVLEIARNRRPAKKPTELSPGRQLAVQLSRCIPTKASGHKSLRSHLRVVQALVSLRQEHNQKFELAARQIGTLHRLLEESKADATKLQQIVEDARAESRTERSRSETLSRELQHSQEQQRIQKGAAAERIMDELNAQRAAIRAHLRERIQNVRLYADRQEPAREKITRLCDEMISFLDETPHQKR